MNRKTLEGQVSPEDIEDYRVFKEGNVFPLLDKKIHILIVVAVGYIVFLDPKLRVHLYYNSSYEGSFEHFGSASAKASDLENTSYLLLKGSQLEAHQRLVGEAFARLLEDKTDKHANQILERAGKFLESRSHERARIWYLSASLLTTAAFLAGALVFWNKREGILAFLNLNPSHADIFLGAAMGSLGASISVLLRSNRLKVDPFAGAWVHYFEAVIRVLVGALAGMLLILAVRSNVLLGAINQAANAHLILLLFSSVAGASELLLPSLIDQIASIIMGGIKKTQIAGTGESQDEDKEK